MLESIIKSSMINAGSFLKNNYITRDMPTFSPQNLEVKNNLIILNNRKGVYLDIYNEDNTSLVQRVNIYTGDKVKINLSFYQSLNIDTYTLRLYDKFNKLYKILENKLNITG
jgi:hypothetical protein